MDIKDTKKNTRIAALSIAAFLILVTAASLLYLLSAEGNAQDCVAEIYQDGRLLFSIPLDQVQETYTLDIEGDNGGLNRIEVQHGGIGVTWADCPDKLCVSQGFAHSPSIPIVCLPNRLVIRLRPTGTDSLDTAADAVTY